MIRLQCSLLCIYWLIALTSSEPAPLVTTEYGTIRGMLVTVKGTNRRVHAFHGVPYAKAPLGELRFAASQPPQSWDGIRDGTKHPPACIQLPALNALQNTLFSQISPAVNTSEDCLFVSVYTPAGSESNRRKRNVNNKKKPVMAFLHGGAFMFGASSLYDGSAMAALEDVVIVTIQYRLGILGYFSTGDERAPGNAGLSDQVQALHWTKKNIPHFGGDPKSVTIFGQSAGGVSVLALMMTPQAEGLFHRAISQSGTMFMYGLAHPGPKAAVALSNMVANATGCMKNNSVDMSCMKSKTAEEINQPVQNGVPALLPLSVDGKFLKKSADELMASGKVNKVPIILGTNDDECGFWIPTVIQNGPYLNGIRQEEMAMYMLRQEFLEGPVADFFPEILKEYVGNQTDPVENRNSLFTMCKDSMFRIPALRTANYLSEMGFQTYMYEFRRRPSIYKNIKPPYVNSDHGDELPFVFGSMHLDGDLQIIGNFTNEDTNLSKEVMKMWCHFAATGNPNSKGSPSWPRWDSRKRYLAIGKGFSIETSNMENRKQFWDRIYKRMLARQTR